MVRQKMISVKLDIVQLGLRNVGSFKELYRNQLLIDDSLDFDFHTVLSSLKILYPGNDIFISFKIS